MRWTIGGIAWCAQDSCIITGRGCIRGFSRAKHAALECVFRRMDERGGSCGRMALICREGEAG
eukprot:7562477-Pyramimonas_sp.AAC.2